MNPLARRLFIAVLVAVTVVIAQEVVRAIIAEWLK